MKTCTKCNRHLPEDEFYVRKNGSRRADCKRCCNKRSADRSERMRHTQTVVPETKICGRCKEDLPALEYTSSKITTTGLRSYCRKCEAISHQEWEAGLERDPLTEKWCPACRQKLSISDFTLSSSSSDGYQSTCRGCVRLQRIKRVYGLSPEQYLKMLEGGCGICGTSERLHIDHDHSCCPEEKSCGQCVRGLLCDRHNRGLGHFRDSPEELKAAAQYLLLSLL